MDELIKMVSEKAGLSEEMIELADYRLRIPTVQTKAESLNVASCGAILMYLGTQHKTK